LKSLLCALPKGGGDSSSDGGGPPPAVAGKSVLHEARALLQSAAGAVDEFNSRGGGFPGDEQLTRVAAKLFNCMPDQLPAELQVQLMSLLSCGSNGIQGYIRPG